MIKTVEIAKEKFKIKKIKKGQFTSSEFFKFKPFIKKNRLSYNVIFTDSCEYKSPDNLELNRLFGLAYGFQNKVSFSWHHNFGIHLFADCVINDKRIQCFICSLDLNKQYKLTLIRLKEKCSFVVIGKGKLKQKFIFHFEMPTWGLELFANFGSITPAPQDVEILMHKND